MSMGLFSHSNSLVSSPDVSDTVLSQSFNVTMQGTSFPLPTVQNLAITPRVCGGLGISSNIFANLKTISCPFLVVSGCPATSSANLLLAAGDFLTDINLPNYLMFVGTGGLTFNGLVLANLRLPNFLGVFSTSGGKITIGSAGLLALNLPSLIRFGAGLDMLNSSNCTSINVHFDTVTFTPGLSSYTFDLHSCPLPAAEVNRLLRLFANNAAVTGAAFILNFTGVCAAPTGDGLTAKAELLARSVTVTTH